MPVEFTINDSFTKKTDASAYIEAMTECQSECPVRTGNLRDSHSVESGEMEAAIHNSAYYWVYVVYGTSRMAANNYPQRAWNTIISQNVIEDVLKTKLKENGIDVQ